jgi:hypothetical protein
MADDNDKYGAAQSIGDYYEKANRFLQKYLGDPDKPAFSKPQKMNWKPTANAEQQKYLDDQKKLADRKPLGSGKTSQKKSAKKQTARKR